MAQVLISNLDDRVVKALQEKADLHGHSLEEEARIILTQAAGPDLTELRVRAATMRERTASRQKTDSMMLLREDRDR